MDDSVRIALVALVVFITHFQDGITGFGCTVLALPFVVLLVGLQTAVPVLIILGWLIALGIVLISAKSIAWSEFARIVVLAGIGVPVGMWLFRAAPEYTLKWILAVFMVVIGVHGLIRQGRQYTVPKEMTVLRRSLLSMFLPLGGMMTGAFGSGGPLVVIYGTRAIADKSAFRVTLSLVWVTLNSGMIVKWIATGVLTPGILRLTGICVPIVLAGLFLGNLAHHRVDEVMFGRIVYAVLVASGFVLVASLV